MKAQMEAVGDAIFKDGKEQLQDPYKTLHQVAEAQLPYFKAMADPNNPVAVEAARKEFLTELNSEASGIARIVPPEEYPEFSGILAKQRAQLNAMHPDKPAVPVPVLVSVAGMAVGAQTPLAYLRAGNVVLVDEHYLEHLPPAKLVEPLLGHELGHSVVDDKQYVKGLERAAAEKYNIRKTPEMYADEQQSELDADNVGAELTSKDAMKTAMEVMNHPNYVVGHYAQTQGISLLEAENQFKAMDDKDRAAVSAAYDALPDDIRTLSRNATLATEYANQHSMTEGRTVSNHPPMQERFWAMGGDIPPVAPVTKEPIPAAAPSNLSAFEPATPPSAPEAAVADSPTAAPAPPTPATAATPPNPLQAAMQRAGNPDLCKSVAFSGASTATEAHSACPAATPGQAPAPAQVAAVGGR